MHRPDLRPKTLNAFNRAICRTDQLKHRHAGIESLEPRRLLASIVSGQTIYSTILTSNQVDTYTFSATAGSAFEVSLGDTDGSDLQPDLHVYDPSGTLVNSSAKQSNGTDARVFANASVTGTYTLTVQDTNANGQFAGPYSLELAVAPAIQAADSDGDGGAIASGQTKFGTINHIGDLDIYTFSAAAGQSFEISLGDADPNIPFQPYVQVYDPTGAFVNSGGSQNPDGADGRVFAIAQTPGTYTAIVQDEDANAIYSGGKYALELAVAGTSQAPDSDGDGGAIASGQTRFGTIDRIGDLDVFTISAQAGQTIYASLGDQDVNTPFQPLLRLYDPSGAQLNSAGSQNPDGVAARLNSTANLNGTYTLVVQDEDANAVYSGGAYSLELAVIPASQAPDSDGDGGMVSPGDTEPGSISRIGDFDLYTFQAVAGDSLNVSGNVLSGSMSIDMLLYLPNGTLLNSAHSSTSTAIVASNIPMTGVYTVLIQDLNGTDTGSYSLTVSDTPGTRSPSWLAPDDGAAFTFSNNTLTVTAGIVSILSDASATNPGLAIAVSGSAQIVFYSTQHIGSLSLSASATAAIYAGNRNILDMTSITIAAAAKLDLNDGDLILNYTGASPATTIRGYLQSGRNNGAWNGTGGIVSSSVASTTGSTIGYSEASALFKTFPATFAGQTIDNTTLLVDFTINGDATLNRTTNALDFNALATNYGKSGVFSQGDFDYSGTVTSNDFAILASRYGTVLAPPASSAQPAAASSTSLRASAVSLFADKSITTSDVDADLLT